MYSNFPITNKKHFNQRTYTHSPSPTHQSSLLLHYGSKLFIAKQCSELFSTAFFSFTSLQFVFLLTAFRAFHFHFCMPHSQRANCAKLLTTRLARRVDVRKCGECEVGTQKLHAATNANTYTHIHVYEYVNTYGCRGSSSNIPSFLPQFQILSFFLLRFFPPHFHFAVIFSAPNE